MLNQEIRKFFSGFYSPILRYLDRLSKLICDIKEELNASIEIIKTNTSIETRPLCFAFNEGENGENPCYNIYGIYKVDETATTLLRYETQFGELIDDDILATITFLPCTCDCLGTGNPLIDLGGGEGPLV
jgi:hypothetical protein